MIEESIYRKMQRCMELCNSSNQNEAAIALKQLQKLKEIHGISDRELLIADIGESNFNTGLKKSLPSWMTSLHTTVAQAFDCVSAVEIPEGTLGHAKLIFMGEKLSVEIAEYAFTVLIRKLKALRKEYISTDLKRIRKRTNKTEMADVYCQAWVTAIYFKCRNLNPNPNIEDKVNAYMQAQGCDLDDKYESRKRKMDLNGKHARAYDQGVRDAADVNLYTAASHTAKNLIA